MRSGSQWLSWVGLFSVLLALGQESPAKLWEFTTGNQGNNSLGVATERFHRIQARP